jgi:hypothetical protein
MSDVYYIIEHPTRGTVREIELDETTTRNSGGGFKARFSVSGLRSDPEKVKRYRTLEDAVINIVKIVNSNEKLGEKLQVRRSPDFKAYCPICKRWCDHWYDHAIDCSVYLEEVARHNR